MDFKISLNISTQLSKNRRNFLFKNLKKVYQKLTEKSNLERKKMI